MDVKIASDWKEILSEEFEKPYFRELTDFVRQEYASRRIFPRGSNIFRAFDKCPFDKLKVASFFIIAFSCIAFFIIVPPNKDAAVFLRVVDEHIPKAKECSYLYGQRTA